MLTLCLRSVPSEAPIPRGVRLRSQVAHLPTLSSSMGFLSDYRCIYACGGSMGELNREALQAATGAFMDRLTDKPTTGDLLAALRFALEAYESVRVAPAPASQHDADDMLAAYHEWLEKRGPLGVGAMPERVFFAGWLAARRAPLDVKHEFEMWMSNRGESAVYIGDGLYSSRTVSAQAEAFAAGVEAKSRAQRTDKPS